MDGASLIRSTNSKKISKVIFDRLNELAYPCGAGKDLALGGARKLLGSGSDDHFLLPKMLL